MVLLDTAALKIATRKANLGVGVTSLCGSLPPSNSFAMILSIRIPIAKLSLCGDITSLGSPLQAARPIIKGMILAAIIKFMHNAR